MMYPRGYSGGQAENWWTLLAASSTASCAGCANVLVLEIGTRLDTRRAVHTQADPGYVREVRVVLKPSASNMHQRGVDAAHFPLVSLEAVWADDHHRVYITLTVCTSRPAPASSTSPLTAVSCYRESHLSCPLCQDFPTPFPTLATAA